MKLGISWRSQSTWAILFFAFIGFLVVIDQYLKSINVSQDGQLVFGAAAVIILLSFIGYQAINARLKGPPKQHAVVTGRFFPSGRSVQKDFFFAKKDPVKRVVDAIYLGPTDEHTGEEVPMHIQGHDIFPYVSVTAWKVDWEDFGSFWTHIWILPDPWDQYFGHHDRPMGAFVMNEVIDHGNSDCVTVYVAPFTHRFLDEQIPIYYGVEGTSTYRKVTRSWQPTMRAIARMDPERVMREYKAELWPSTEIDDIVLKKAEEKKAQILVELNKRKENGGK